MTIEDRPVIIIYPPKMYFNDSIHYQFKISFPGVVNSSVYGVCGVSTEFIEESIETHAEAIELAKRIARMIRADVDLDFVSSQMDNIISDYITYEELRGESNGV